MRYIITESQLKLISEQSMVGVGRYVPQNQQMNVVKGMDAAFGQELRNILGIGSIFIPVIGPLIAAGMAAADVAEYWKKGDKKTASMVVAFSFLPFVRIGKLIPSIGKLGEEGMEILAKKIGQNSKNFTAIEKEVIEGMSKNKEMLSQEVKKVTDDLLKKTQNAGGKALSSFGKRFSLGECFAGTNCPAAREIISDFYSKLGNSAKLTKFFPSEVKVLSREVVAGREVIETQLKDGTKVLFYKSSGANVATTGKQAGEWFVIPGFAQNGWFFKTAETINLTKGGNKYLTDMAEFLQLNGSQMLGR